jgi:hypothetical protein
VTLCSDMIFDLQRVSKASSHYCLPIPNKPD